MGDMDPLVLGLAVFSAACFLAFALWPRSSAAGTTLSWPVGDGAPPNRGQAAVCLSLRAPLC
jgi:hypothetical protein